jgi:hypothetical protein
MKDLNLTVQNTEGKEIVFRVGEADKVVHPKAINISGILAAPHQFLIGKDVDAKKSHIEIKKDSGEITLIILDTDPHSTCTITGKLKKDTYFDSWKVNTEHRWTVSDFLKHVKKQRVFFTEKTEADAIVESLQKWNAKVEVVIKQHNDNSGNSLSMLERKVGEIDLKKSFKLSIPIFQGYAKQTFTVEVGFDPKNTQVDLYLFSNELFELEILHREKLIEEELAKFSDFKCSQVVLS